MCANESVFVDSSFAPNHTHTCTCTLSRPDLSFDGELVFCCSLFVVLCFFYLLFSFRFVCFTEFTEKKKQRKKSSIYVSVHELIGEQLLKDVHKRGTIHDGRLRLQFIISPGFIDKEEQRSRSAYFLVLTVVFWSIAHLVYVLLTPTISRGKLLSIHDFILFVMDDHHHSAQVGVM